MLKKHMTPLGKGGSIVKHKGKGSQMASMPSRSQIQGLGRPGASSMNDYAKATPMAQGVQDDDAPSPVPSMGGGF
jgi:hypothetical protein